ncbi:methyltransferase domain-containing protein [Kineococcus esterisolvens]|uniref:methyltransferase domain-containing protein n=1 Tax=unclassified Kineococcus TaxID=2621656 RepID=UPI003D7C5222
MGPVLDLGCGPGHLAGLLRSAGSAATGIDLVPELVAHARRAHPAARFEVGSPTDVVRPDGPVAVVPARCSLVHPGPGQVDDGPAPPSPPARAVHVAALSPRARPGPCPTPRSQPPPRTPPPPAPARTRG